jgi:hypothetical protein
MSPGAAEYHSATRQIANLRYSFRPVTAPGRRPALHFPFSILDFPSSFPSQITKLAGPEVGAPLSILNPLPSIFAFSINPAAKG